MKKFWQKHYPTIILSITGIFAGILYWHFVGCQDGTCPIKSKWYLSGLYGGIMGLLIGGLFIKKKK